MRIYVACLASYNNGRLHGRWIDASPDIDAMQAEIGAMLRESPFPNVTVADWEASARAEGWTRNYHNGHWVAPIGSPTRVYIGTAEELCTDGAIPIVTVPSAEEWAIHDSEGLGDIGEYAGLAEVARRASVVELAEDRGIPLSVLLEFARDYMSGNWDVGDLESSIDDRFSRGAESWRDFAEEFCREVNDMRAVPDWMQYHIDWDSIARDFELSGDFVAYRDETGDLFFFHGN